MLSGSACSTGGSGSNGAADRTTTSVGQGISTTVESTVVSSSTAIPGGDPALESLILTTVPSGLQRQPDNVADSGPVDLAKAIQDEVASDAAETLRTAGFLSGYQRTWADATQLEENVVFLYRFASATGAARYASHRLSEFATSSTGTSFTPFLVFLPSAGGLQVEGPTSSVAVVVFSKGVYSVEAVSTSGTHSDQSPIAAALAVAQYRRIP